MRGLAGFQLIPLAGGLALLEGRILSCSPTLLEEGAEGCSCSFISVYPLDQKPILSF